MQGMAMSSPTKLYHQTWLKQHEHILRQWKSRCFVNLWLQIASGYYYNIMYNWFSYPVIIMSSLSSAALLSTNDHIMKFLLGALTLSCGIITAVTRQLKPGEMYQDHSYVAKRYLNLIRNIDTCLSLTHEMRPEPQMFLDRVGNEIDMLEATQHDPPLLVVRNFEKKYGPLYRVLYGEDILQLMKIELVASNVYSKAKMNNRLSDVSSDTIHKKTPASLEEELKERFSTFLSNETSDVSPKHQHAYSNMDEDDSKGTYLTFDVLKRWSTMTEDEKHTPTISITTANTTPPTTALDENIHIDVKNLT